MCLIKVEILQSIATSPGSAEIKKDGEDITGEFLDEYGTSIVNDDYEAEDAVTENIK